MTKEEAIRKALDWGYWFCGETGDYGEYNLTAGELDGWPQVEETLKEVVPDWSPCTYDEWWKSFN